MPEPLLSWITKLPLKISHSAQLATFKTRQNCLGQAFHLTCARRRRKETIDARVKRCQRMAKTSHGSCTIFERVCGNWEGSWLAKTSWLKPTISLVSHDIKHMFHVSNAFGVFYRTWIFFAGTQFLKEQLFCWLWNLTCLNSVRLLHQFVG